jgi:hypothetical protein
VYTGILAQTGGGGGNWIQIIVIVVMVGLSALSWLFQKLSEQAQKKKQLDQTQKREQERLRTGRDPSQAPGGSPQTTRQQELAARRQAQLEELRRRQQDRLARQGQAGPGQQGPPSPVVFIPGSSGPIVVTPRQSAPPSRPMPRPQPQQRPQRLPQPQQRQQPRPVPTRPQPSRPTPTPRPAQRSARAAPEAQPRESGNQGELGSESHRLLADRPDVAAARAAADVAWHDARPAADVPKTRADWRRAIIAREILAPPVAMRPPDHDPLP